nr:hypothetical protein [Tanacetum cinerariifolium]
MDFRNFMYVEDDEDLSFLPRETSLGFRTSSPFTSINNKPQLLETKPLDAMNVEQSFENTVDSRGSRVREGMLVIGIGSVTWRMKEKKRSSPTKAESSLFLAISDNKGGLPEAPELQTATDYHMMISNVTLLAWIGHIVNQLDVELLDLHDRCYARQSVVDNVINQRAREFMKVVDKMKRECDVLKDREKEREKEYEELRLKCKAAMTDFENNLANNVLRQKIKSIRDEVAALEAKKSRLEVAKAMLRQEVKSIKGNRADVVSKVVSYVAMELVHSDEIAMLVGNLVPSVAFYGRCASFEEVANLKESFDLANVKGYRPSYKKEHLKAGNGFATATFPFLTKVISDLFASVEALLSKNPKSLRRPTSTKTLAPALSAPSHKATLSSALVSKTPNLHITYSHMNFYACLPFAMVRGFASIHLVKCSKTIAKNFKFPEAVGGGPTMLLPIPPWLDVQRSWRPTCLVHRFSCSGFFKYSLLNRAYVYSFAFGLTSIRPAPEPSKLEALSEWTLFEIERAFVRVELHVNGSEPIKGLLDVHQHVFFGVTLDYHIIDDPCHVSLGPCKNVHVRSYEILQFLLEAAENVLRNLWDGFLSLLLSFFQFVGLVGRIRPDDDKIQGFCHCVWISPMVILEGPLQEARIALPRSQRVGFWNPPLVI